MSRSLPNEVYLVLLDEEPNCSERAQAENMRWIGTELGPSEHINREILGIFYTKEDAIEYAHEYALNHYDFDSTEGNDDDDDEYDDWFWFDGEGYLEENEESNLQNDIRLHITVKAVV